MHYRLRSLIVLTVLAAAGQWPAPTIARAQSGPKSGRNLVFTEPAVFLPGTRTMLSPAYTNLVTDPRGRYALIGSNDLDPLAPFVEERRHAGARLLLYDGVTNEVRTVWHQNDEDRANWRGQIVSVDWLPGTDTALAVVSDRMTPRQNASADGETRDYSLLLIRAPLGSAGTLKILSEDESLSVAVSPHRPVAVVDESRMVKESNGAVSRTAQVLTVNAKGIVGSALPLSETANTTRMWDSDGITAYFTDVVDIPVAVDAKGVPVDPQARRKRVQWFGYNFDTQKLTPLDRRPVTSAAAQAPSAPTADNLVRLVRGAIRIPRPNSDATPAAAPGARPVAAITGVSDGIAPLWLVRADGKSEGYFPTTMLVAPDARWSELLADDSAVLYVSDGAVYALPFTQRARPEFDALYQATLKSLAMMQARNIGIAMMMYSQDYNGNFPPGGDVSKSIKDYLMNSDILSDPSTGRPAFTYLLDGDPMSTMKSPGTTAAGYVNGPGGKAVVYADGHVRWQDTSPAP